MAQLHKALYTIFCLLKLKRTYKINMDDIELVLGPGPGVIRPSGGFRSI